MSGDSVPDDAYEMYCLTDPVFYDSFILKATEEHDYEVAQGPVPKGWQCIPSGDWLMYVPQDPVLPAQGWKIHAIGVRGQRRGDPRHDLGVLRR